MNLSRELDDCNYRFAMSTQPRIFDSRPPTQSQAKNPDLHTSSAQNFSSKSANHTGPVIATSMAHPHYFSSRHSSQSQIQNSYPYCGSIQNYSQRVYDTTMEYMLRGGIQPLDSVRLAHQKLAGPGITTAPSGAKELSIQECHNGVKAMMDTRAQILQECNRSLDRQGRGVDEAQKLFQNANIEWSSPYSPIPSQPIDIPNAIAERGEVVASKSRNLAEEREQCPLDGKRPTTPPIVESHLCGEEPVRHTKGKERLRRPGERKNDQPKETLGQPGPSRASPIEAKRCYGSVVQCGGLRFSIPPATSANSMSLEEDGWPSNPASWKHPEEILGKSSPSRIPPTHRVVYAGCRIDNALPYNFKDSLPVHSVNNLAETKEQKQMREAPRGSSQRLSANDKLNLPLRPRFPPTTHPELMFDDSPSLQNRRYLSSFTYPEPLGPQYGTPGVEVIRATPVQHTSSSRHPIPAELFNSAQEKKPTLKAEDPQVNDRLVRKEITIQNQQERNKLLRQYSDQLPPYNLVDTVSSPTPTFVEQNEKLQHELREEEERGEKAVHESKHLYWGRAVGPENHVKPRGDSMGSNSSDSETRTIFKRFSKTRAADRRRSRSPFRFGKRRSYIGDYDEDLIMMPLKRDPMLDNPSVGNSQVRFKYANILEKLARKRRESRERIEKEIEEERMKADEQQVESNAEHAAEWDIRREEGGFEKIGFKNEEKSGWNGETVDEDWIVV